MKDKQRSSSLHIVLQTRTLDLGMGNGKVEYLEELRSPAILNSRHFRTDTADGSCQIVGKN